MKELIISNLDKINTIALIENGELVEKYEEREDEQSIEGNIYIGKVQNVLPGLQSAFIDIGERKNAFIYIKDILPKVDITKEKETEIPPIGKIVKQGDPIIVEVKRETIEHKGPKVSTHINITGRFIVFMPNATFITVSHKIEDEKERVRLKEIAQKCIPQGMGAIVRTVAAGVDKDLLEKDIQKSVEKWEEIKNTKVNKYPKKIYSKGGILKKTIVDLIDSELDRIIVNNDETKAIVQDILDEIDAKSKVEVNSECMKLHSLEKQIEDSQKRKVWLKCGGFITIDKTEALTAIDVNSGKFIGEKNANKTIRKVNSEAAKEIAKQIRLRDISGIIIVDFIDMFTDEDKKIVVDVITKESRKDRSRIQIEEFTKLNLMELTRRHINGKRKTEKMEE